tara:strand:+ start:432 stop:2162 length:1731 start_codon:yes stop_codon:yes gene_type:complete
MARQIVGNPFENQIPNTSPTARVVETYVQPVKNNDFEALTQMLNNLDPKVKRNAENNKKRADDTAYSEGLELYNKTRVSMGEAVKQGIFKEGENPYIRKGYRTANLNAMGIRYATELYDELNTNKLYTNDNPADIDKYSTDFYKRFTEKNDLSNFTPSEIAQHFTGEVGKANEAFRRSWLEKNIDYASEQAYEGLANHISTVVSGTFKEGDNEDVTAIKKQNTVDFLNRMITESDIDGLDRSKVNAAVVDSVILSAYETNDLGMLDLLNDVKVGTGPIGKTIKARQAILDARRNISTNLAEKDRQIGIKLNAQNKQKTNDLTSEAYSHIESIRDNDDNIVAYYDLNQTLDKLKAHNTTESLASYKSLLVFRDAQKNVGVTDRNEDGEKYATVMLSTYELDDKNTVLVHLAQAVVDGDISPTQSRNLLRDWSQFQSKPQKDDLYNTATGVPQVLASFLNTIGNPEKYLKGEEVLVQKARHEFDMQYMDMVDDWMEANPDKKLRDRDKRTIAYEIINSPELLTYVGGEALDVADQIEEDNIAALGLRVARQIAEAYEQGLLDSDASDEDILNFINGGD